MDYCEGGIIAGGGGEFEGKRGWIIAGGIIAGGRGPLFLRLRCACKFKYIISGKGKYTLLNAHILLIFHI